MQSLRERLKRRRKQARPRREQMSKGRRGLEVGRESESSQRRQDTLWRRILAIGCFRVQPTHHRDPDMNPPTGQELMHDRPFRREHIRILFSILRGALRGRQTRPIIDRLAGGRSARRVHDSLRVRRRTELIGLAEGVGLAGGLGGLCTSGAGRGEAAAGGVDAALLLEGL